MSKLPVSQEALLLVKLEFMNQVSFVRFSEFIRTCSFSDAEERDLIKYAKQDRWDQEYGTYGDVFRRMFEDRMVKEIRKTTNLGIKSGRTALIKMANKAMNETNSLLEEACKRVPFVYDKSGNRHVIKEEDRNDNFYLSRLEIIRRAVDIGDRSQKIWAAAVGLQDALRQNFPDEETGQMNDIMVEMLADLKDMVVGEEEQMKPGNGKATH